MGSMFFQFLGIFSEFENTIRKERQVVGIRKAKERGVRFGRKPTTEAQIAKIQWMKRNGSSIRAICKEVKVSPNTVYAAL
jgi:DNA invertase Pin-like site-specific DNA recombinase